MKEIVAVVNQKGGAGKTTTAHALGEGLKKKGFKVLFIDLDGQASLSDIIKADRSKSGVFELLTKRAEVKSIIQTTQSCDILTASEDLFKADITITEMGKEYCLKEALEKLEGYDYVIIDTPPALGILTVNALVAASSIVIASQADSLNLSGIERIIEVMDTVRKYCNKKLSIRGILLTRFKERTRLNKDFLVVINNFAKKLKAKVYKTTIRDSIVISESQAKRMSIFDYDKESNVAKDYNNFVEEFLKQRLN
jgi:chromosome partitioning protein